MSRQRPRSPLRPRAAARAAAPLPTPGGEAGDGDRGGLVRHRARRAAGARRAAHDAADAHRRAGDVARARRSGENRRYLPGVELPAQLRIEPAPRASRAPTTCSWRCPRAGSAEVIDRARRGRARRAHGGRLGRQGPRPPAGAAADDVLERALRRRARRLPRRPRARAGDGARRRGAGRGVARGGAGAARSRSVFTRAGVVCELSNDPVGVELAGAAKNAAALAAGATEAQGLNAAGRGRRAHLRRGLALRRGARRATRSR